MKRSAVAALAVLTPLFVLIVVFSVFFYAEYAPQRGVRRQMETLPEAYAFLAEHGDEIVGLHAAIAPGPGELYSVFIPSDPEDASPLVSFRTGEDGEGASEIGLGGFDLLTDAQRAAAGELARELAAHGGRLDFGHGVCAVYFRVEAPRVQTCLLHSPASGPQNATDDAYVEDMGGGWYVVVDHYMPDVR